VPMRSLARSLRCDASNVTGIIDRLEHRGLVLRAALKTDRRVKMLVVTDQGMKVRKRMLERLSEAPEPIARLSDDDQRALCEILKRAVETTH
jgi:MarR family transcriptional regulator, organic hydroperoxide resistance regulator